MRNFFVDTRRGKVFVQEAGEGKPVIFIHGALLNSDLWLPQLDAFSHQFRCIAYDLRGHGRSGPSNLARYSTSVFAEDLFALVDALDIRRPILCGLSMGGMIAQSFTAKYPERARGLILCDTGISTSQHFTDRILNQVIGLVTPIINVLGVSEFRRFTHFIDQCFGDTSWVAQTERSLNLSKEALDMVQAREVVKIVTAVRKFNSIPLYRPKIPTLIVNGEHDSLFILRQAKTLQGVYPNSRYRVVPRAGHLSNLDNPEVFNSLMEEFLEELSGTERKDLAARNWFVSAVAQGRQLIRQWASRRATAGGQYSFATLRETPDAQATLGPVSTEGAEVEPSAVPALANKPSFQD
jgi:pimeloyl-ACP methyl ester carboxylesterase